MFHRVPESAPRQRLDRYAAVALDELASTAAARKAARRGELWLNGQPCESSRWVRAGDRIEYRPGPRPTPRPVAMSVEVLLQDEHLAVVVKPPGIHVSGARARTLEAAIPGSLAPNPGPGVLPRPRAVHRLDRRTGGLLLVARTGAAQVALGRLFEQRLIHKRYRALSVGRLEGEGTVELAVDGRHAVTRYRAVEHTRSLKSSWITTVDLWPRTGRTHQLRRHLAQLSSPVLGDDLYGAPGLILRGKGLYLFAVELGFDHPFSGERVEVELAEPAKFGSFRRREDRRWRRYHGA